ncbi:uncharacterized protein [Mycetomoellerius zeteki]|uniref:uncharacterized protein n=1 Tax=Mycetomoellerius zeteki TaxID=64791 RepID=UPI00084E5FD7|nr:PREDICTED: uncharacterized protein LOC108720426 [Trachymyrmex zeteki]
MRPFKHLHDGNFEVTRRRLCTRIASNTDEIPFKTVDFMEYLDTADVHLIQITAATWRIKCLTVVIRKCLPRICSIAYPGHCCKVGQVLCPDQSGFLPLYISAQREQNRSRKSRIEDKRIDFLQNRIGSNIPTSNPRREEETVGGVFLC